MKQAIALLFALSTISLTAVEAQDAPGAPPVAVRPFPDVPPGHWAAASVEQLHRLGVVRGQAAAPARPAPMSRKAKAHANPPRRRKAGRQP